MADKLAGFDAGTDDYLTKPFALEELAARLKTAVRRHKQGAAVLIEVGDLEIDIAGGLARRGGRPLSLNKMSFLLLVELARKSPSIVDRATLEHALWGDDPPLSDALRSQVYVLRQAVDRPFAVPLIQTVHGFGYRLVAPT